MKLSGTYLKSKVAKQVALLLFLAAAIPASLMTLLSYQKINDLSSEYNNKSLVEKSNNYALNALSNLIFARGTLERLSESSNGIRIPTLALGSGRVSIFSSLVLITANGKTLREVGQTAPIKENFARFAQKYAEGKIYSVVIPPKNTNSPSSVYLALPRLKDKHLDTLLIAKLNPDFLWGEKEDYPSDTLMCAYQLAGKHKTLLFCSGKAPVMKVSRTKLNTGAWELFMRGEFYDDAWLFETTQLYSAHTANANNIIGSSSFISVAMLSLLIVGFLGLIQIRRTMMPLESLIDGTRKISQGDFTQVNVSGHSEFSELASAFNGMSAEIKRQVSTLQSFSFIDRGIVSNLDLEHLIEQILQRMHSLKPDASFYIFHMDENTGAETQCNVHISGSSAISSMRITISTKEIGVIKSYGLGHLGRCKLNSNFIHEGLTAEMGDNYIWVAPIFWQNEMCAFLVVGSTIPLKIHDHDWHEFRELASRIGIVISAQQREEKLLMQAQYDSLTGLPNRILLQDRLRQAIDHSTRSGDPAWVLFLDLDRFKYVNDSLGHHTGDELLIQIAKRLQSIVRENDTVARFGGDEFVIILQGKMDDNLRLGILNRLIESVATPVRINNHELITTCSIGVAVYPNDGNNTDTLIKHADIAMYRAKELGKNNFQFFTQFMNKKAAERMRMEFLLRKAMERNELQLHYQPKVDLTTHQIVGLEALIRWNNEELGMVSPATFIPLAEETGLILEIGECVIRQSCIQAVAWQKAGLGELVMSVNLSARQFGQYDLAESIRVILVETGLKAEHLELELTESLFMKNSGDILKVLHEIKALGVKLSIDDFGTGYSNLSYLNSLPLDTLKIDKTFTDDILLNHNNAPIVDTIITLAKNLELTVVAEGVESATQVTYLSARGCDQIQGYYFSRPEPAEQIKAMLIANKKLTLPSLKSVPVAKKHTAS